MDNQIKKEKNNSGLWLHRTNVSVVIILVAGFCLVRVFGPGFDKVKAADDKAGPAAAMTQRSYEISVEDGVMHFDVAESADKRVTYSSDCFSIRVTSRTAWAFWLQFVSIGDDQEVSIRFLVQADHFHRLAEMFDIVHIRNVGGTI